MRFVPNNRPLPKRWVRHPQAVGVIAEKDIRVHRNGRIAAKLLVFKSPKLLRSFWKKCIGSDLGPDCLGAVNALAQVRTRFYAKGREESRMTGDRRYFCVIGLCATHLEAGIVTHEAVHAGYCYHKRVKRNTFGDVGDFDEELIAYPTGIIAAKINDFLHSKKLYS